MIQRVYIDTSVFGGLFDQEFSFDTSLFFDRVVNGEFRIVYSEVTNDELKNAPNHVKSFVRKIDPVRRIRGYNSVNLRWAIRPSKYERQRKFDMKTKETKTEKDFDAVAFMRQERDRISKDIVGMDFKEIQAYFSKAKKKEKPSSKRVIAE